MTSRVLPEAEWSKLDGLDIAAAIPFHRHEDVQVVVVEDARGSVVGAWAVLKVVQLEGVWIAPEHRKHGSVARRLLHKALDVARTVAPYFAFTGAETSEIADLLTEHLGAKRMPMDTYVIPLRELPCR